jgi:hypothetical protein
MVYPMKITILGRKKRVPIYQSFSKLHQLLFCQLYPYFINYSIIAIFLLNKIVSCMCKTIVKDMYIGTDKIPKTIQLNFYDPMIIIP